MLESPRWSTGLRAEILDREALADVTLAWHALCARAAEDNVYYSPRYAQALLQTVDVDCDVRFALAWDGHELIGFLPFTAPRLSLPDLHRVGRAWMTPYTFSCTPLLESRRSLEAAGALLDALGTVRADAWLIPFVNVQGAACQAMLLALEQRALSSVLMNSFERASLDAQGSFEEHLQQHVSSNRRKGLARTRRGLEAVGRVEHLVHRSGEGLSAAVEAFLDIERRGWKGECGTALDCHARTRAFACMAFTGSERDSMCRADVLALNGTPIAVSLTIFAAETGYTVKGTYDETYRRFSPGLLLELEVMRSFLTERWAARLDAATAGSHVLDSLWPGRMQVADVAFSLDPRAGARRLAALQLCEAWKRSVKTRVREMLRR